MPTLTPWEKEKGLGWPAPFVLKTWQKLSVFRKPPCFQKLNNRTGTHTAPYCSIKSMVLYQFVPYQGTVHCTVQVRVRVQGPELPHIYMGFNSQIYTRSVEPAKTTLCY